MCSVVSTIGSCLKLMYVGGPVIGPVQILVELHAQIFIKPHPCKRQAINVARPCNVQSELWNEVKGQC